MKQSVMLVIKKQKFRLNQLELNLYIVENATKFKMQKKILYQQSLGSLQENNQALIQYEIRITFFTKLRTLEFGN